MPWTQSQALYAGWKLTKEAEVNDFATRCATSTSGEEDPQIISLGPFGGLFGDLNKNNEILVRDWYTSLFQRTQAYARLKPRSGLAISGQPGTGKTFYLFYLLFKLLQLHEIVIFYFGGAHSTYLFIPYNETYRVYTPSRSIDDILLPPCEDGKRLIWSLVEASPGKPLPSFFVVRTGSFLVQAPSPSLDPAMYRNWLKQRNGLVWGMTLWSSEELLKGLRLCAGYPSFEARLKRILENSLSCRGSKSLALKAARDILRRHIEDTEDITSQATSGELSSTAPGNNVSIMSLEEALRILVDNAIKRHGPIPRDVFRAVLDDPDFDLREQTDRLDNLNLTSLRTMVTEPRDSTAHNIIRVQPVMSETLLQSFSWETSFKSDWVAKNAPIDLTYNFDGTFRDFTADPSTTPIAGQLFEIFAHNVLRSASSNYYFYQMDKVERNDGSAPEFTSRGVYSSGRRSGTIPKRDKGRKTVWYDGRRSLGALLKDSQPGDYFLPKPTNLNFPFFDAFFYESTAVNEITLYILQMTSPSDHRDESSNGYASIRDIVYFLQTGKDRYNNTAGKGGTCEQSSTTPSNQPQPDMKVTVQFLLVCPFEDGKPSIREDLASWQMPDGWGERLDHDSVNIYGDAYLLPIHLDPRPYYRPSTPISIYRYIW